MNCMRVFTFSILFLLPHFIFSQTERWVYKYSGLSGRQNEVCNAICYGSDDNIYAAGTGCRSGTEVDIVVVSLSTSGMERWVYVHNGYADFDDYANAIVRDVNNNVYVGGSSYNSDTISDFIVISLTSEGNARWVYRHQGPYIGSGCVRAIAIGSDGNIYAAGYDERFQSGQDFIIVCLDTSGVEQWVYRYDGPGYFTDDAYSIACGLDGNIYAAGISDYSNAVVLSLTANGTERWVYQYDEHYEDRASSVVFGADSNVYVFGTCSVNSGYVYSFLFAISLNDAGVENWTYGHSMPSAAASGVFGEDGHIYCAGAYGSDIPVFMAVGIDNSGFLNWEYLYGLPTTWATSITYGSDGYVYVAGCSKDSIAEFTLYFTVVSLYTSGTQRWTYEYGGPEFNLANALCYGADSNLYVGGRTEDSFTGHDFTVISLDPAPIMIQDLFDEPLSTVLQIVPNPFRHSTDIGYQKTDDRQKCDLRVYDIAGRLVIDLSEKLSVIGCRSSIRWDGTDDRGKRLPAGVYFVQARTGDVSAIHKVVKLE
jgi:hypothetical protein